ncbi:Protein kinase domain-containing protein ppk32 [Tieghemiomyces parasiticus]|uniref:Protein kinase domain-containing protein ppk32 n=1 Tax=Tieghemiomyces parasiticus TaxID=78921 RepID=A0A9W7ZRU0_9FUNG|nr:Protein kinase domain-containing protein ppk32 [Tieghemiomyces parasiticus]
MQSYISSLSRFVPSSSAIWREYEAGSDLSGSGLWTIQTGKKRSSGQPVAIFTFDKKYFDHGIRRHLISKHDQDRIVDTLKKEVSQLTRLRHPSILQVVEPLEETRTTLCFVTEPITGCLADMIAKEVEYGQRVQAWNTGTAEDADEFELDTLEIQKGLLQVAKALQFCHQDAKLVHGNLTPNAIFVNAKGDWKLGGLGFSTFLKYQNGTLFPTSIRFEFDHQLPAHCQQALDYLAPEFVLDNLCNVSNDLFALGCFAVAVHGDRQMTDGDAPERLGQSVLHCRNDVDAYRRALTRLPQADLSFLPGALQPVVRHLLMRDPDARLTLDAFQTSTYFDNVLMSTIKYLETLVEKSHENKVQFLQGLLRILPQYPDRILKRKILAGLLEELKDHPLLPYTLPNVFYIVKKLNSREFMERVFPDLKQVLTVRDPPQSLLVLLESIDLLRDKTLEKPFRDDVMPVVHTALESGNPTLIDKALQVIPQLSEVLDYTLVKTSLFPKVQTVYAKATILSVKINALKCFHAMLKTLDKFTMTEKLVPMLKRTKTREPGVLLAIMVVYEEMGLRHLEKEAVATDVIPELWRLCMEPQLSPAQFQRFTKVITDLSRQVEQQQLKHLQDLARLHPDNQPGTTEADGESPLPAGGPSGDGTGGRAFEYLIRSGRPAQSSGIDDDNPFKNMAGLASPLTPKLTGASAPATGTVATLNSGGGYGSPADPMASIPVWGASSSVANNLPAASTSNRHAPTATTGSTPIEADNWQVNWETVKPSSLGIAAGGSNSQGSLKSKFQQYKQSTTVAASTPSGSNSPGLGFGTIGTATAAAVSARAATGNPRPAPFPAPTSSSTGSFGGRPAATTTHGLSSFALPKPPRSSSRGSISSGSGNQASPRLASPSLTSSIPTPWATSATGNGVNAATTPTSGGFGTGITAAPVLNQRPPPPANHYTFAAPSLVPLVPSSSNPATSRPTLAPTAKPDSGNLKMFDPFSS